jgi:hypothetical protein
MRNDYRDVFCIEIRTSGTRLLINLLYFGPEFSRKFQELFASGNKKPQEGMVEEK